MRAALAALLLIVAGTFPAAAQMSRCADRSQVVEWLQSRHQEKPVFVGSVGDQVSFELWASDRGSWTLLRTTPTGIACLVAAGQDGEVMPQGLGL